MARDSPQTPETPDSGTVRPMNGESKRSLPDVIGEVIDILTKFSIPLYVNDEYQHPVLFGTGFFVRAG